MAKIFCPNKRGAATLNEIETPVWVKYAGDIFYLLVFLVILFFVKPEKDTENSLEDDQSESPNPLETMLVSEENPENIEAAEDVKPDKTGKIAP